MTDAFRALEQSYEAKFKIDEELKFKAGAKRNKKLGLWAAEKFGLTGQAAEAYAVEVIDSDFEEPGIDDVIRKVTKDFSSRKLAVTEDELLEMMDKFFKEALTELGHEFPTALDTDHAG